MPAGWPCSLSRRATGTWSRSNTPAIGKLIRPSDPSTWPTKDEAPLYKVQQARRMDLWGNLSLLVVLCALLGTDWLLRLLRGYV